jgi:1,5-anhydro-D-fructose reductase (1,5-anhydro-D-mannitol-forming)
MTVGWGIIGIGRHADRWMAPAIERASGAHLAAVYSRDQGRADAFAAKHGAAQGYADLDALLADPAVEIVYIGSPSDRHAEHAVACAAAGKHILVDKPLGVSVEDCQAIIAAANRHDVLLSTGYNQRYQPAHEAIRDLFQSGELGDAVLGRGQCSTFLPEAMRAQVRAQPTSGMLLATGIHVIDLLRWWFDDEVVEVAGITDASDGRSDEMAIASLRFSRGAYAQIDCGNRLPWPANDMAVHAEQGYVKTIGTMIYDTGGQIEVNQRGSRRTYEFRPSPQGYGPFSAEIDELSRVVREGGEVRATGQDGLEGVRVAVAVREASTTGRTVRLMR